jgi:hypothetical protein
MSRGNFLWRYCVDLLCLFLGHGRRWTFEIEHQIPFSVSEGRCTNRPPSYHKFQGSILA